MLFIMHTKYYFRWFGVGTCDREVNKNNNLLLCCVK